MVLIRGKRSISCGEIWQHTTKTYYLVVWPGNLCTDKKFIDKIMPLPVQAFISSRLDYCNALLYGVSDGLMLRLQLVQNAAAQLETGARHREHITSILRQLHWLPVRQRVTFKITVLLFQRLTGQAPAYLTDDCQLTSDVSMHRLRSIDIAMCIIRRSNNSYSDRCFAAAGPRLSNTLPVHLRQCDSLGQFKRFYAMLANRHTCRLPSLQTFKRALKTKLFRRSYDNAH